MDTRRLTGLKLHLRCVCRVRGVHAVVFKMILEMVLHGLGQVRSGFRMDSGAHPFFFKQGGVEEGKGSGSPASLPPTGNF